MSIRQWEILKYPNEVGPTRYRLSLFSDGGDVGKVRGLFPGRVGAVWVPRRKPFNAAFFLYGLSSEEIAELEQILKGDRAFPETPYAALKTVESSDAPQPAIPARMEGGSGKSAEGLLYIGYFVPESFQNASDLVHAILTETVFEKKIGVSFEKIFSIPYQSLALSEIHKLIQKCHEHSVNRLVAIGDPIKLVALKQECRKSGITAFPLAESVIDRNFWITLIAEIISAE
jgi:hypothetical protein